LGHCHYRKITTTTAADAAPNATTATTNDDKKEDEEEEQLRMVDSITKLFPGDKDNLVFSALKSNYCQKIKRLALAVFTFFGLNYSCE
jgi:hypothetical protein